MLLFSSFLFLKSLHLIFAVAWFAGLFYLVRLFIYHTEAKQKPEAAQKILIPQYSLMERRLLYIITLPAMAGTLFAAIMMLYHNPNYLLQGWLHIKFLFIILLIIYQIIVHKLYLSLKKDKCRWKPFHLRLWNELATILLVGIIFLAVYRSPVWQEGVLGFLAFVVGLWLLIFLYKKYRLKSSKKK